MAIKARAQEKKVSDYLEAIQHPLRYKILCLLVERTASPKELADALDADLSLVSHHTKRLVQLGCAELVTKRIVRNSIVEHFYKATRQSLLEDTEWLEILDTDPRIAEHIIGRNGQLWLNDLTAAVTAGTFFEDDKFLFDRVPVTVDAQGRDELIELFERVEDQEVVEILQRSVERRAHSDEKPIRMSAVLGIIKTSSNR